MVSTRFRKMLIISSMEVYVDDLDYINGKRSTTLQFHRLGENIENYQSVPGTYFHAIYNKASLIFE